MRLWTKAVALRVKWMCLSFYLLNPLSWAFQIQSEGFSGSLPWPLQAKHCALPLHLLSILFSFDESAPVVFLLFVCGISVCLNEISMTDGKSVVGISVHSHGECWATGIGFRFGVGGREWVWVWDSWSSCMRDAGPYLFFRFQLRIASCGKLFMTTDSACVRAC